MIKFFQPKFYVLIGLGLLLIVACSQTSTTNPPEPTAQTTSSPMPTTSATTAEKPALETATKDHSAPNKGGQVVEVGKYHLELVALPEATGTHLDFYLLTGDNHQAVADAKVTAQIEVPNGEQQTLDLIYDFLEIEPFTHSFENLKWENMPNESKVFGMANMHSVNPRLKPSQTDTLILSEYVKNK